ncbi:sulfotransferase [bacterium]|nr:sulfotransferase [bacterium]
MKTIILAGTGRSGTTIAADVINAAGRFRFLFEPLFAERVPLFSDLRAREYLGPERERPDLNELFDRLLEGDVSNEWTDRHPIPESPQGLFIKMVRANLLLGWLHRQYPELKLILMLRHPLAVSESRLRMKWPVTLGTYTGQKVLRERYLEPYEEVLAGCGNLLEKHVAAWCIETLIPLAEVPVEACRPLVYEQLVEQSGLTLLDLGAYLGESFGEIELARLDRPSETSMASSANAIRAGKKVTKRWMTAFSPELIDRSFEIVESFGLVGLYGRGGEFPTIQTYRNVRNEVLKKLGREDEINLRERYNPPAILSVGRKRPLRVEEAVALARRGLHRAALARLDRLTNQPEFKGAVREAKREITLMRQKHSNQVLQQQAG